MTRRSSGGAQASVKSSGGAQVDGSSNSVDRRVQRGRSLLYRWRGGRRTREPAGDVMSSFGSHP